MYHCLLRHEIEDSVSSDHISFRVTFYVTVKFLRIHHPLKYPQHCLGRSGDIVITSKGVK